MKKLINAYKGYRNMMVEAGKKYPVAIIMHTIAGAFIGASFMKAYMICKQIDKSQKSIDAFSAEVDKALAEIAEGGEAE